MKRAELLQRAQFIDRRIVYVALAAALVLPFFMDYSLPIYPDTYTRMTFETIEQIAGDPAERDKVVIVLSNYGPGSEGENGPQAEAVFRHFLRRRIRFVLLSTAEDPTAIVLAETRLQEAIEAEQQRARRRGEPIPNWEYGVDYLNFGFRSTPVFEPIAKMMVLNTREFFQRDRLYDRPLTDESFPLLERFHGVDDISLVFVISFSDEAKALCGIVQRQIPGLKVAEATMGIVANDLYPLVRSGQMCGLLNSARAAAEYRSLLDPDAPNTTPIDNSMSLGKMFLLLMLLLGNTAYLASRRIRPPAGASKTSAAATPMRPLSSHTWRRLFIGLVLVYLGATALELWRDLSTHTLPRQSVARLDADASSGIEFERVDLATLKAEQLAALEESDADEAARRSGIRAEAEYLRLAETRIGEFVAALMTLGILAFLLGDNRFYRYTEAIMVGGVMAYFLVERSAKVLKPMWFDPIVSAASPGGNRWDLFWLSLLLPGCMWYCVYSKRYRWLNQLVVGILLGCAVGPEFGKQVGLIVPQIVDSIRPVWPFESNASGGTVFSPERLEHLIFVTVMVLSLLYFVFFIRPTNRALRGVSYAGRLVMMIGFGAMFGNTVNTRLAWLAPRIGFLVEDWLGKLFA